MIDDETKEKLIKEMEKSGNIYSSCTKIGIARADYYRWINKDSNFKKKARKALKIGRENMNDIAEHALMQKIKQLHLQAIMYYLGHNSPRYRKKSTNNIVITHKKDEPPKENQKTLEDFLDELEKRELEERSDP